MIKNIIKCSIKKQDMRPYQTKKKNLFLIKSFFNKIFSNSLNYTLFFYSDNTDLPISLSCRKIVQQNLRNIYGQFYIGPFFVGQGLTIANALRRTLLSELSSLSITSVQIQDVVHQYQTIQGLQESVFDFLLNMKDVVFKSNKIITTAKIGYLQVQGPCVIKAKHLSLPPFLQCVDPDQYIATLADDGFLNLKFLIRQGKHSLTHVTPGYDLFSKKSNKQADLDKSNINFNKDFLSLLNTDYKNLIIDASFNPVIKVNYIIELLDFDQNFFENDKFRLQSQNATNLNINQEKNMIKKEILILEIWTNGSISPIMALKVSIQKLIRIFLKIQKSRVLKVALNDLDIVYKDFFEELDSKSNKLNFRQCQTLSDFKDSQIPHISEKFFLQKLKYLINKLESF